MPPKKRKTLADIEYYDFDDPFAEGTSRLEQYTEVTSHGDAVDLSEHLIAVSGSPKKKTARPPVASGQTMHNMEDMFIQHLGGLDDIGQRVNEDESGDGNQDNGDDTEDQDGKAGKQPRGQLPSDIPLHAFLPHLNEFVNEILRLESPEQDVSCGLCAAPLPDSVGYRCKSCMSVTLACRSCTCDTHRYLPFHIIERWNGHFFDRVSLKQLGIRIQLGHDDGSSCPSPRRARDDDFVVVHSNGVESVGLDFCGCPSNGSHVVQLLRRRLFPATVSDPQTAATFEVLGDFQMLSFVSKISAFEFVNALERKVNNTGTQPVPPRYPSFRRMVHVFRHVRMLKRFARGHFLEGVASTKPGQCVVACPACPLPGINMPTGWEKQPRHKQFVHRLFIAIDANFRLRRKDVSSDVRDPGLNRGYAYIVNEADYKEHLTLYDSELVEEKSSCNNHDAIKSAQIRGGKGLAATGLAIAQCSRHDMRRPEGAGDLQKGERQVNIDYVFLKTASHNAPPEIVCSYDVACQWSQKLADRCKIYPKELNILPSISIIYLVPKYHLAAHIPACRTSYSFNFTPGVGRTDGEAPERNWSVTNGWAYSTREMGPGSRRDTLDDNFGYMNWEKTVAMPQALLKKAEEAISMRREQVAAFKEFSSALPQDSVTQWTQMVQAWEKEPSKDNPFVSDHTVLTANQVRLRLAEEDAKAIKSGEVAQVHKNVTQSGFIRLGIELEDLQRKLAVDAKSLGAHATDLQRSKITERSNALRRRIIAWIKLQSAFMSGVGSLRIEKERAAAGDGDTVYTIPLLLPSSVAGTVSCDKRLAKHEQEFRIAQAESCLQAIRAVLMLRSHLWRARKKHASGYRQQTRSNALLTSIKSKLDLLVQKYRFVFAALENLAPVTGKDEWKVNIRRLTDSDVRGLSEEEEGGEGSKRLTWIWTAGNVTSMDGQVSSDLRVEWCKTRARAHRWQEECLLLAEEIRRVEAKFEYDAKWWTERAAFFQSPESYVAPLPTEWNTIPEVYAKEVEDMEKFRKGKTAYARRQAAGRDAMLNRARKLWSDIRDRLLSMEGGEDPWKMVEVNKQ